MNSDERSAYRPLSSWAYWGLSILYAIPVIGFVFLIIFSFSNKNINRRNFTRSYWCRIVVFAALVLILWVTGVFEDLIGDIIGNFM